MRVISIILLFGIAILSAAVLSAETNSNTAADQEQPTGGAASTEDKTGTNPLNFQTEFRIFNEYQDLPDSYRNFTNFRYVAPFADRKAAMRLTLPVVATDLGDGSDFGLGDFNFRINYVPKLTPKYGWVFGLETEWDTASDDTLGTGKNTLAPVVVYVRFLPGGRIFAPAYQQKFSIGGDDDRPDINLGLIDLYYVMQRPGGWIIVDPTIIIDYENGSDIGSQLEVELGRLLDPKWGGVSSWYFRPGIGIGAHRAYDWNFELGYKVVGF